MRNRYSGLLAIVLTSSICANAQSIDGKVMENDSIPVPYATVSLLQASDSAYVAGVIGGEDGSFSFDTNSSGKIVKVSCIGYKTVFLPAAAHMTIHLLPSEQALQGVTVTASRPSFKMEQGQFVTHIQGTVVQSAGAGYRRVAAIAPDRHRWHQSAGKRRAACLYQQQTDAQLE